MRNLKMMVTSLALAGLAGCGTAWAAERSPSWVAPSAASQPSATSVSGKSHAGTPDKSDSAKSSTGDSVAQAGSDSGTNSSSATGSGIGDGSASDGGSLSGGGSPAGSPTGLPTGLPAGSPAGSPAGEDGTPTSDPASPRPGSDAPVRHGDGPAKSLMKTGGSGVALTFDDGPDPVQTPKMLDLLKKQGVKATFCLVGENVAAHPDLVRRIAAEGHTLCNHTWNHSLTLGKKKPAAIRADLKRTNDAILAAVPGAEIKYMRAPGGNFTPAFVTAAADLGMTSIYWQLDPRDWDHTTDASDSAHKARVIKTVKTGVSKGTIILSHDYGQPDTIAAYQTLIPWLKTRYKLIALP